jgi:protein-S-isoprenylcysteine O-methyltransferase Ste14
MNNKIPPPIVTLFCGLGIYCSSYLFPTFSFDYSILISIIFVLIGFFIFLSAIRLFKKHETTVDPSKPEKASSLITNGVSLHRKSGAEDEIRTRDLLLGNYPYSISN